MRAAAVTAATIGGILAVVAVTALATYIRAAVEVSYFILKVLAAA